jgi:hypothetical protein
VRLLPLCLLLLAACSAAPGASSPADTAAPTTIPSIAIASPSPTFASPSPTKSPDAGTVYSGVLSSDVIEGGCTYLKAADGRKLQVIYPDGWTIRQAPLKLLAPDGSVHSRGGDRVSIRGSEAPDMTSICQIGPIIQATEVLGP